MEKKKTHDMSVKRFCRFSYTGDKAKECLFANMKWLRSHSFIDPILDAFVAGNLDAGLALAACKDTLQSNRIAAEILKGQQEIIKRLTAKPKVAGEKKVREEKIEKYTITIYCKSVGGIEIGKIITKRKKKDEKTGQIQFLDIEKEMVYSESLYQRAQNLADRKLVSREDAVFAEIKNNYGGLVVTAVPRSDAFARYYKKRSMVATRNTSKKSAPLKNYAKSKNDRSIGPWSFKG